LIIFELDFVHDIRSAETRISCELLLARAGPQELLIA
jgi:hypothetical protein